MIPGALLLAVAVGISAQTDRKNIVGGESTAERLAEKRTQLYVAPRVKTRTGSSLSAVRMTDIHVAPGPGTGRDRLNAPVEYAADLKGMVFGSSSAELNTILPDGSLTPVPGVNLAANMALPGGGCGSNDTYYTVISYSYPGQNIFYAFAYDPETWMTKAGWPQMLTQKFMSTDITWNPADDKIYGCFTNDNGDGYEFGTVDFTEGERTVISRLPAAWNALAASKDGTLYAIDMEGTLFKVDKNNGEATEVGATGYTPVNMSSATFDHKTGKLYWTVSTDSEGFLCEVDTATGAAVKITDFPEGEEVYGLWVNPPAAEDRAPAAPTNLSLDFEKGDLTGTLLFDAPATLFCGEEGEGEMNYRIMNAGKTLTTGTTSYGMTGVNSAEFSVPAPGKYKFTLICSNNVGDSPKADIEQFIGADAPSGVTDAKATYADGVFTVTWTAPAMSANGGYINPDEILYTVTRLPDNKSVADRIKDTSITDAVAEPESFVKYKYAIQAEYDGYKSMTVNTNGIGIGNILPPYTDDFSDVSFTESYTLVDGNSDGRSWAPFAGMAQGMGPVWGSEDSHADEWLITPAIRLEGGKFYKFGIKAATMGTISEESFEVAVGTAPTAEAMTDVFLKAEAVQTASFMETVTYEEYFTIKEDGIYYIGMHHNTAEGAYFLLLDDLSVSEPIDGMSPDAVSELTVTPWADGVKKVTVAFNAPAADLTGQPLPFLDRIEITMDGTPLHTVRDIAPGDAVRVDIDIPTSGLHKFVITAFNGSTEGRPVEVEIHVGLNVPAAPDKANASCDYSSGEMTLKWDKVSRDIDGKILPEDGISYLVVRLERSEQTVVASDIRGTEYTYLPLTKDTDQQFFQYAIFAKAEAGYSTGTVTQMVAAGRPDTLPWKESFADGMLGHQMAAHPLDGTAGGWQTFGDQSFSMGVKSYDSDNGMLGMYGPAVGDAARIFTGRIDMTNLEHPALTFYTFNLQNSDGILDQNELTVLADEYDGQGFKKIKTLVINEVAGGVRGWTKAVVDLSSCAGKTVSLAFDAVTKSYLYTIIDVLEIKDRKDSDMAITLRSAPGTAEPDKEFVISVDVENTGRRDAAEYSVRLFRNGDVVRAEEGSALKAGEIRQVTFTETLNSSHEDMNTYHAEVVMAGDENTSDNATEEFKIRLRRMDFPGVRDLKAVREESGNVTLRWTEPEQMPEDDEAYTEGFESAETDVVFPTEFGAWSFLDLDEGYIGGIRGMELPGIQTGSQQSFWVLDTEHPVIKDSNYAGSYAAKGGTKYLAQMYTLNIKADSPVPCDDWIISPMLNEKKQTIEFHARSYGDGTTSERFQLLYSSTGTAVEDFTRLTTQANVPLEWTRYSFEVPEGTRYFAIRCTTIAGFMFFVDNVTYIPANGSNVRLEGYNVYVDGRRVNDNPVVGLEYMAGKSDGAKDAGTRYSVSAVYNRGESRAEHAFADGSNVEHLYDAVRIEAGDGCIVICADGMDVTVWSASGLSIYAGPISGEAKVDVHPGVYIVRYGDKTAKLIVR